jgi:hypothetical protein
MRTVQVYIEGQRLDLFDDETISVTSKQQDIQDISKVFTDFSQSFSVPSTPSNDAIFQHFYQNDVDSTIDHNIRRSAFIEIDLTTFRTGTISLEKAEIKDNQAYSYQITFYGDITSLKDKFGDDKLSDMNEFNIYNFSYNDSAVQNRITDGSFNYGVRFPLIFNRDITYDTGDSRDISPTGTGSVLYNELFPAIQLLAIFNTIQTRYDVTFSGTFFSDKRFQNAYLYCKNSEDFTFVTDTKLLDMTGGSTDSGNYNTTKTYLDYFDLSTDTLSYGDVSFGEAFPNAISPLGNVYINDVTLTITSLSPFFPQVTYYIDVILNNQVVQTFEQVGTGSINITQENNVNSINKNYSFRFRAQDALSITFSIRYLQFAFITTGGVTDIENNQYFATGSVSVTDEFNVVNYVPDMKVSDFFSGILKMFNLTCYGTALDTYQVEPLDDWYAKGAVVDITQYTDIKSVKIDRIKLFKTVEFKYQESESATNHIFRNLTGRDYGNTKNTFDYDGGDFTVELPFENMQMQKFQGTNLQIGETINIDANKYVPKPMIIYQYEELSQDYRFTSETSTSTLTEYVPFGQDVQVLTENYTLNFNADISTLTNIAEQNTLFKTYYSGYLFNLFNLKNRQTTVKTNLPVSLLTNLRLNDRVIIRDKRYIIQSMKSNLNTGEVDFVLINDFRPILLEQLGTGEPLKPNKDAQDVEVRILFPNDAASARITTTTSGVTISPSNITSEGIVTVSIPDNPNATTVLKTEDDVDYINTENTNRIRTEGGTVELITLNVEYTYINGTQTTSEIYIQQQP